MLAAAFEERYRIMLVSRHSSLSSLEYSKKLFLANHYVPVLAKDCLEPNQLPQYVPSILAKHKHILVLGSNGSGKTTLLKVLAYSFGKIQPSPISLRLGSYIPIFICLSDFNTENWNCPTDMWGDYIRTLDANLQPHVSPDYFISLLKSGRGALLVDDFNQADGLNFSHKLWTQVLRPLLDLATESLVVITGLTSLDDFDNTFCLSASGLENFNSFNPETRLPEKLKTYTLSPWTEQHQHEFQQRWLFEGETWGRLCPSLKPGQLGRLTELATCPALFSLITSLASTTHRLPFGLTDLCQKSIEPYFNQFELFYKKSTNLSLTISYECFYRWLSQISWLIATSNNLKPDKEQFKSQIDTFIKITEFTSEEIIELQYLIDFLFCQTDNASTESRLLRLLRYPFFKEYFIARYLWSHINDLQWITTSVLALPKKISQGKVLHFLFEMLEPFPEVRQQFRRQIQKQIPKK